MGSARLCSDRGPRRVRLLAATRLLLLKALSVVRLTTSLTGSVMRLLLLKRECGSSYNGFDRSLRHGCCSESGCLARVMSGGCLPCVGEVVAVGSAGGECGGSVGEVKDGLGVGGAFGVA